MGRISKFAAMNFTASQIAEKLNGKIQGNPESIVNALAKIEEGKNGDLCFLSNPKYTPFIYKTKASIVIVNKDFKAENPKPSPPITAPACKILFFPISQS